MNTEVDRALSNYYMKDSGVNNMEERGDTLDQEYPLDSDDGSNRLDDGLEEDNDESKAIELDG